MPLTKLKKKIGLDDYLEGEMSGEIKHEYIYGEIYAMAGTSDRHNRISLNFFSKIDAHLNNSEYEIFIGSVKLKADAQTFYYPDVMVACDRLPESAYYREQPYIYSENDGDDEIELQSINLKIKIEEIYRRVRFEN